MEENLRKSKSECLLEGLTPKEVLQFNKFITVKLNGKGESVSKYWAYQLDRLRGKGESTSEDCSGNFSRKTASDFVKILEEFLALKGYESDLPGKEVYLTKQLRKRNVDKYFTVLLEELKTFHNTKSLKGHVNVMDMIHIYLEEYFLYNSRSDETRMYETSLTISSLAEIILIQSKLFEYVNKRLYAFESKINYEELVSVVDVVNNIKSNDSYYKQHHQNIYLMYLFFEMFENFSDDKRIFTALTYLEKHYDNITVDFLQFSYETILRFLIFKINSGCANSFKTTYDVFKEIEAKGLLGKVHHIQPLNFISAVSVSLAFGDLDFVRKLIAFYDVKVNKEYRSQVVNLTKAMLELNLGNFETVKKLLKDEKPNNLAIYLFTKTTFLKALYESRDFRNIVPYIDNVKHYLNRQPLIKGAYKESIFKFLHYLSLLTTIKRKGKGRVEELFDNISDEPSFFQRKWVLAKAEELVK